MVTVSEVVLLPGPDSLLAPAWVPWSERVRPGDIGVGDLMPPEDDERLVPVGMLEGDDGVLDWDDSATWDEGADLAVSIGPSLRPGGVRRCAPGRPRVLSAIGRDLTAARWYSSEHGPGTPLARAAPGPCVTCGFLTPLAGPLGRVFGVCANEYAPDDGRVVSLDHGCGAHSEAVSARADSVRLTGHRRDRLRPGRHARRGPSRHRLRATRSRRQSASGRAICPPALGPAARARRHSGARPLVRVIA